MLNIEITDKFAEMLVDGVYAGTIIFVAYAAMLVFRVIRSEVFGDVNGDYERQSQLDDEMRHPLSTSSGLDPFDKNTYWGSDGELHDATDPTDPANYIESHKETVDEINGFDSKNGILNNLKENEYVALDGTVHNALSVTDKTNFLPENWPIVKSMRAKHYGDDDDDEPVTIKDKDLILLSDEQIKEMDEFDKKYGY